VLTGALLDCVGADDGVCRVLEARWPDECEPLLVAVPVLLPVLFPVPAGLAGADELVLAGAAVPDRPEVLAAACEAPGSTTAITPAATALATPVAAVAARTDFRPRSRSAIARDIARVSRWPPAGILGTCPVLMRISITGRLP
jgi:hypothetical protein